ncbi:hypothetical protein DFQ13_108161 [Actinokineospora spheciospongiae]|nr:hypothetical protein DFQ13_108161 [Actinokineospora spheciospongiae]
MSSRDLAQLGTDAAPTANGRGLAGTLPVFNGNLNSLGRRSIGRVGLDLESVADRVVAGRAGRGQRVGAAGFGQGSAETSRRAVGAPAAAAA